MRNLYNEDEEDENDEMDETESETLSDVRFFNQGYSQMLRLKCLQKKRQNYKINEKAKMNSG